MKLHELRQKREQIADTMRQLHNDIGDKEWSEEQQSKWNASKKDCDAVKEQIKREEELQELDQRFVDENKENFRNKGHESNDERTEEQRHADAFDAFLRSGAQGLDDEQLNILKQYRAQALETDEKGGFTAPNDFQARIVEKMKAYGGLANVATLLSTSHGRNIDWVTSDGTAEEGELLGENKAASELDTFYGIESIGAKKLSSKIIRISDELLQDSSVNIAEHLSDRIAQRIGRAEAKLLINGTGSGTPEPPKGLANSVTN